jgi:uncharacterized protein (DUF4415 family)
MNNQETNVTDKITEFETTEFDARKLQKQGTPTDEIPPIGIRRYRRARHVVKPSEAKIKITLFLDGDVLMHFKGRAESENSAPYQTQINAELRKIMKSDQLNETTKTAENIVNDNVINLLADKIAERLNERKAA